MANFISMYGSTILYTLIIALIGYFAKIIKKYLDKWLNTQEEKEIAKSVVLMVEQVYKNVHGEEKLNLALENLSSILATKGITMSDLEMRVLVQAAVGEFNKVFEKNNSEPAVTIDAPIENKVETNITPVAKPELEE